MIDFAALRSIGIEIATRYGESPFMNRRTFLLAGGVTAVTASVLPRAWRHSEAVAATSGTDVAALRENWRRFVPDGAAPPAADTPLDVADEEWRERLDEDAFRVLFRDATEPPGSSPLDREKREGLFVCAACELPLFTSAMKYDSGTGWPSFFTTIPGHLGTSRDFKLIVPRTEYHCVRCGGHQGHVFDDGPAPTNERWCNNGVALAFLPLAADGGS